MRSQRGLAIDCPAAGTPGAWASRAGPMGSTFACTVLPPRCALSLPPSGWLVQYLALEVPLRPKATSRAGIRQRQKGP